MTPLLVITCAGIVLALLAWSRFRVVSQGERSAKAVANNLTRYQDQFGERADARQFIANIMEESNRLDHFKTGGTGAIGARLAGGDVAGAALITAGKFAIDGAVGLVSKLAGGLSRVGERAVSGDGPESDEQAQWEFLIRADLERLLAMRRSATRLKGAMFAVGASGAFVALVLFMQGSAN
jgi:hypothetical protein